MGLFGGQDKKLLTLIKQALSKVKFPKTNAPLLSLCNLNSVHQKRGQLTLELEFAIPCNDYLTLLNEHLTALLLPVVEFEQLVLKIKVQIKQLNHTDKLEGIKQIVLIASGKGGVGKSTTSVNLALALASGGATVGLLDADIFGPSIPMMLNGIGIRPESHDGKLLEPVELGGLKTMSLGFLVSPDDATVWRGPMASRALAQLIFETHWGELDYLVVDMPPGTGDIQLTMTQQVPVSGAVVVTTPQNIALADAQKGIAMFNKVNTPVLGVIENMSYHQCGECGHTEHIFGRDGGDKMANDNDVTMLGHLPLQGSIRQQTDCGEPTVLSAPISDAALAYKDIALNMAIALNKTDMSIPSLVISQA
ncbi:MAG: iron-sulfur cluster carrier protein ApbC [Gammaproteobacteria bacterium]|nr:iron-sulfur cluster carrier protein ApbC [Gammaproteobacteria bacterium]